MSTRSIYEKVYSRLPSKYRGALTKSLYGIGIKPIVEKNASSTFEKGILVFSADFEMSWAFRYSRRVKEIEEYGLRERHNVPILLEQFNRYKIPVTWATVGHLYLSKCAADDQKKHPEMVHPNYFSNRNWDFNSGSWYDCDPCTNVEKDPAWYAPDLIDQILKSEVPHEMGCHTFSHIDFSDRHCSSELAESELKRCISLAHEKGQTLQSMVFPGGTSGNYATLKKMGFTNYRKPFEYQIGLPKVDRHGLVAIPSSLGIDKDEYGWPVSFHKKNLKRYIDKAMKERMVCHFWFHPSLDTDFMQQVFPYVLSYARDQINNNKLQVMTMSELASAMLKK